MSLIECPFELLHLSMAVALWNSLCAGHVLALQKNHKHSKQICSKIQIDCCYGFFAQSPATPQNDALSDISTDLYTLKFKARRGHAVQQNIANQHCTNA